MNEKLWICWEVPRILPGNDVSILSFLSPAREEGLKAKFVGTFISARQIAPEVKERARKIYVNLIARIGATPVKGGKTLRQALEREDGISLWWFHKVSEKDCESDHTFNFIIEVLIIISVAEVASNKEIVLFGGYKEISDVLKGIYKIKEVHCRRRYDVAYIFIRGGLLRIYYFFTFLLRWLTIKRTIKAPKSLMDVAFSGFWDWSVKEDRKTGKLNDRYFKSLPEKVSSTGLKTGWFLWLDPYYEPGSKGHRLRDILEPVKKHDNLVILQNLIQASDLIKAILNYKPYLIFLNFSRAKEFKDAFIEDGINFYPLLQPQLSYGFLNSTIPNLELVYTASLRAFKKYQPKVSVSFLELLQYSRAFYEGGNHGCQNTVHYAMQHASYSREKTFVLLDPEIEYNGHPDNCSVPKPDYVFAMGELGKEIFIESGFPPENIFLTGSTRYEHIKNDSIIHDAKLGNVKNLLIVTSLDINLEIEMVEAVYLATMDLPQIKLLLRSHPFASMDKHPKFVNYQNRIELTSGSLDEDLEKTDLIIFSYSTVAEEALIRGIPVWQWLSASYNGSVFRDLKVIPSFYSVSDLRDSLKKFISNPTMFIPPEEVREFVLRKCFYIDNEKHTSDKIAEVIASNF